MPIKGSWGSRRDGEGQWGECQVIETTGRNCFRHSQQCWMLLRVQWTRTWNYPLVSWLLWIVLQWTYGYMCAFQGNFVRIYAQEWDFWVNVVLYLVFWGTSILFSIVVVTIYIPTKSAGGSLFSTPPPEFVICWLVNDGHSDKCEVVPPSSFYLHYCNNQWCWTFFRMPVDHQYMFLWRNVYSGHLPIFQLLFFFCCWVV